MLNITVINCDDKKILYEYDTSLDFVRTMESNSEVIPMLDDVICELEATCNSTMEWWRDTNGLTVNDLLKFLKKQMNI